MTALRFLSVAAVAALLSSAAVAGPISTAITVADISPRGYIGVDGLAYFDKADNPLNNEDLTVGMGAIGVKAGIEIYDIIGVEARAGWGIGDQNADFTLARVNYDLDEYYAGFVKLQTPSLSGFRVYGLAGLASTQVRTFTQDLVNDVESTVDDEATDFAFGGGISFDIINRFRINAEYVRYREDTNGAAAGFSFLF